MHSFLFKRVCRTAEHRCNASVICSAGPAAALRAPTLCLTAGVHNSPQLACHCHQAGKAYRTRHTQLTWTALVALQLVVACRCRGHSAMQHPAVCSHLCVTHSWMLQLGDALSTCPGSCLIDEHARCYGIVEYARSAEKLTLTLPASSMTAGHSWCCQTCEKRASGMLIAWLPCTGCR